MSVTTSTERTRNPRGQGDRLRADLLDAASELLAEHGSIDKVSLRAVAARAGVSPTAVYRHFDDHLALMRAAIDHCWREFTSALSVDPVTEPDPFERFTIMGQRYVEFATAEPGMYRVIFSNDLPVEERKGETAMAAFGLLVDVVAEMLNANSDGRDAFFVSTQVHTWIHGMVDLCTHHPDLPFPTVDELVAHLPFALDLIPREPAG